MLIRISWRSLGRNMVRTSIAVLAIATVVTIVIFARALMVGSMESSFRMYIDNTLGHVRITDEEYAVREVLLPLDYTIDGPGGRGASELLTRVEASDQVEYVLPRIRFAATADRDGSSVRMIGVGIDPSREARHGALPGDITAGRMPAAGMEVLVGRGLLEQLGAGIGDQVSLVVLDADQSLREFAVDIVGVREAGVSGLDDTYFYLPLATAREILGLGDAVTELLVFGGAAGDADRLEAEVDGLLERAGVSYATVTWNTADPFVEFFSEATKVMDLVYVAFILMGAVVIVTTLTMIVRERTPEIGMMSALGLRGREIMTVFVLEGTLMGVIGSLIGVGAGGLITYHFSRAGLHAEDFARLSRDLDLLIEPVFYLAFNLENLIVSFLMGVAVVTLSCLYPAFRAARLEPVDALHHVDD